MVCGQCCHDLRSVSALLLCWPGLQVLFTVVVPISGALSDRGLPRVTTNIVIACISGAAYVPTFLAFQTRSVVACWLLQAMHLSLVAWAMGVLPVIVSRIYPAGVRISGFNLGHNFGEGRRPSWRQRSCCTKTVLIEIQQQDCRLHCSAWMAPWQPAC